MFLFDKMQKSGHCLCDILPSRDAINISFRPRGHSFQLPNCSYVLFKNHFWIDVCLRINNSTNPHVRSTVFIYFFSCIYVCYMQINVLLTYLLRFYEDWCILKYLLIYSLLNRYIFVIDLKIVVDYSLSRILFFSVNVDRFSVAQVVKTVYMLIWCLDDSSPFDLGAKRSAWRVSRHDNQCVMCW